MLSTHGLSDLKMLILYTVLQCIPGTVQCTVYRLYKEHRQRSMKNESYLYKHSRQDRFRDKVIEAAKIIEESRKRWGIASSASG